jgi:putative ABC transport system permease protein
MAASGASLLVLSRDAAGLEYSAVPNEDIETIARLPGVEDISRSNFTMVPTPRAPGEKVVLPVVFCFGRVPGERIMVKYEQLLVSGRLFAKESEIVAGRFLADALGWNVGTRVTLFESEVEVVGVLESDIAWENGGILVHADVLAKELRRTDSYSLLFVYTGPDVRDAVRRRIEEACPKLVAVPPAEFTARFSEQLELADEFIALITVIATVIGVLGVLNTMMMSVSERTREIGTLRALGWSRRRVLGTIVVEGLLLSALGGAFGLLLGWVGTEALISLYDKAYLIAKYVPSTFAKGGIVALGVGLVAALYPAFVAANLRPVEALRYE